MAAETVFYKRATFVTHLPNTFLFSPSHYWLAAEENNVWRVGFTKFATRMLSGEIVGSVEGFKAISDLYSPVGGMFIEGNQLLSNDVELISREPYREGWLFRVRGTPDSRCIDVEGYRQLLDATIDRMLEKQQS